MLNLPKAEIPPVMIQREVAEALGVTVRTMRNWLADNYGPPAVRIGRTLVYDRAAVDAFRSGVR